MTRPAIIRVYQNLAYEIVITRGPGEDWPPLVIRGARFDVTQVEIRVSVFTDPGHEPVLDCGAARVIEARLIRVTGGLGRKPSRHVAYGGTGRTSDPVDVQAGKLDEQARKAALAAYRTFIASEAERMAVRPSAR